MKLIKMNPRLNEAVEDIGNSLYLKSSDVYKPELKNEFEKRFRGVSSVAFADALEDARRWREEANKKVEERRALALETVEAADSDRFKHMDNKEKRLNSGEKLTLSEALEDVETVEVENAADEFLTELALADFHDWQQLAMDLLDNMTDEQVEEFKEVYAYTSEIPGVNFEKKSAKIEEALEDSDIITAENLEEFTPWGPAILTWENVQKAGRVPILKGILSDMSPEGISVQALNELLSEDADFIYDALRMNADGTVEEGEESDET